MLVHCQRQVPPFSSQPRGVRSPAVLNGDAENTGWPG